MQQLSQVNVEERLVKKFESSVFKLFNPIRRIEIQIQKFRQDLQTFQSPQIILKQYLDQLQSEVTEYINQTVNHFEEQISLIQTNGTILEQTVNNFSQKAFKFFQLKTQIIQGVLDPSHLEQITSYTLDSLKQQQIKAHSKQQITSIEVDDRNVITASTDGSLIIWKQENLEKVQEFLSLHSSWIRSISVLRSSKNYLLASAGDDSKINIMQRIGNCLHYKFLCTIESQVKSYVRVVRLFQTINKRDILLSARGKNDNFSIVVYDVETQSEINRVLGHDNAISILKPLSNTYFFSSDLDGLCILWRIDGLKIHKIKHWRYPLKQYQSVDYNGQYLALGTQNGVVRKIIKLYLQQKLELVNPFQNNGKSLLNVQIDSSKVQGVKFISHDIICLLFLNRELVFYNYKTRQLLRSLSVQFLNIETLSLQVYQDRLQYLKGIFE